MRLGSRLDSHVEKHALGVVLAAETGFIISRNPDTVRAPNAAFIAQARLLKEGLPQSFIPFAPDLAIEVLSPGDSQIDTEEKIQQWLNAGTTLVWVVNPRGRTVTIHKQNSDPRVLRESDTLCGENVCPGFALKVADILASESPELSDPITPTVPQSAPPRPSWKTAPPYLRHTAQSQRENADLSPRRNPRSHGGPWGLTIASFSPR